MDGLAKKAVPERATVDIGLATGTPGQAAAIGQTKDVRFSGSPRNPCGKRFWDAWQEAGEGRRRASEWGLRPLAERGHVGSRVSILGTGITSRASGRAPSGPLREPSQWGG